MPAAEALRPIHTTENVNDAIGLLSGDAVLTVDESEYPADVKLELAWLPSPGLNFTAFVSHEHMDGTAMAYYMGASPEEGTIRLVDSMPEADLPVRILGTSVNFSKGWNLRGDLSDWPTKSPHTTSSAAMFHVANLRTYLGNPITEDGNGWLGRAEFSAGRWAFVLDQVCPDRVPIDLKRSGGYAITHVGHVVRTDEKPITAENSNSVLNIFGSFLSFCNGRNVGACLRAGTGSSGSDVRWTDVRIPRTAPYRNVESWWNQHVGPEPFACFARFLEMWQDDIWEESLRMAVYWYLAANRPGREIEGTVVLCQLAFECLADTLLVEDRKIIRASGLKKLETHGRLRLLLATCDIPPEIPASLTALNHIARKENWDVADCVAFLRNCHAHPTKVNRDKLKQKGITSELESQVSRVSLHLLELVILRLIGYQGRYLNRFTAGYDHDLEYVPWAQQRRNEEGEDS